MPSIRITTIGMQCDLLDTVRQFCRNHKLAGMNLSLEQIFEEKKLGRNDIVLLDSSAISDKSKLFSLVAKVKSCSSYLIFMVNKDDLDWALSIDPWEGYHFIKYPFTVDEIKYSIKKAKLTLESRNPSLVGDHPFDLFVGESPSMATVYEQILKAAETDVHVLILGETGTGKDITAKTIHQLSARRHENYIPVNIGAIPRELIASELFGYEKGAFTGAQQKSKGKFELGNHGTVFLDEIGSIDAKVQVSLLRLLDQKAFYRLGGKRRINIDCRIIAATNEDLRDLVNKNLFREDLFYRLDVFRIVIPPLRDRYGDISLLVKHFLDIYRSNFNKKIEQFSSECLEILKEYKWPGNVRELSNVVQRAVLMCNGTVVLPKHLPPRFHKNHPSKPFMLIEFGTTLEKIEKSAVIQALRQTDNQKTKAAKLLGISRRAIYNKLGKYQINPDDPK
ncbi:sigma-54-dependent Fis family transcriptional regulator [candidate division KSB1 bacterium]|nr:sigma-54-dependent Fis family transcriptional regulator [candidate division KSB1 bacterium]